MRNKCTKQGSVCQVVSVEDPPVREAGQSVADVDELVGKLKEKGFSS